MFHNLRILAEKHSVSLLSFIENEQELDKLEEIEGLGVKARTVLRRPVPVKDLLLSKPKEHWEYASADMRALVRSALAETHYDVVQAEFVQMGQHVPQDIQSLRILTEHEVHFANSWHDLRTESSYAMKIGKLYGGLSQFNYEIRMCRRFDRVVCMTEQDLSLLRSYIPSAKLKWIPIGVDSDYFQPRTPQPESSLIPRLLFVGNYRHPPNREAVLFFIQEVLPRLRSHFENAEFYVAGANSGFFDRSLLEASRSTRLLGYLPDIRAAYDRADIFVAPLRSGNGMRVKLLEAFSMGKAVVATRLAAAGFSAKPEEHLLLAESPEEFVVQIIRLLQDPTFKAKLGANARRMIREHYDWSVLRPHFLELVENRNG